MDEPSNQSSQPSVEEKLKAIQDKWLKLISDMNEKMRDLAGIDSLLNEVYSKRQDLLDYYFSIHTILIKLTRGYKVKYAERYNYYKSGKNGLRYTNDSSIATMIEADLDEDKQNISLISSNIDFCKETLKTIDNIIYGIKDKLRVYELMNNIK